MNSSDQPWTPQDVIDDLKAKGIIQFDQGKKHDNGKPEWNLLYYPALERLVRVMMMGRDKYGFENWKKPFDKKRLINAGMRHLISHLNGEYLDNESNEPHIIHTMANCMMLYFHELKNEMNNLGKSYEKN